MTALAKVAIVTDSASSLPKEIVEQYHLRIVPTQLIFQGHSYSDGVDLEPSQFYRMLRASNHLPTTSAPSPVSFLEAFEKAGKDADSVLCLTLSSSFSATFNNAQMAVEMAKESLPDTSIDVLDTGTAAGGEALVVLQAARTALSGGGLVEVMEAAQKVAEKVNLVAFLDTLYFLWKGGRVPRIGVWVASLLQLKPLLEMSQGQVRLRHKPRTRQRATERLIAMMRDRIGPASAHVSVMHADALEEALALKERIAREFTCSELLISEFTPVMGAHIGPGLLGLAFWGE